ncbi:MAG: hypothetical protein VYB54_00620 [Pseudomonadota bacterium]|nr:hypothetical protein [Pseudomonadota bacterium]
MNRLSTAIRDLRSGLAILRRGAASFALILLVAALPGIAGAPLGVRLPVLFLVLWLGLSVAARHRNPAPVRRGRLSLSLRGFTATLQGWFYGAMLAGLTLMVLTAGLGYPVAFLFGLPGLHLSWPDGASTLEAVIANGHSAGIVTGAFAGFVVLAAILASLAAIAKFLPVAVVAVRDRVTYATARTALEPDGANPQMRLSLAVLLAGLPAGLLVVLAGLGGAGTEELAASILFPLAILLHVVTAMALVERTCPAAKNDSQTGPSD